MTRFWWHITEFAARALDAGEREAVIGDLTETAQTGPGETLDVLGLVMRRQLDAWNSWPAWIVLLGAIPVGFAIKVAALWLARLYSLDFWIFANSNQGLVASITGRTGLTRLLLYSMALALWAWAGGFALGALSKRTRAISLAAFSALLLQSLSDTPRRGSLQFAILSLFGLVLVPAASGILTCRREIGRIASLSLCSAASASAIVILALFWWPNSLRMWATAGCWPLVYLAVAAYRQTLARSTIREQVA